VIEILPHNMKLFALTSYLPMLFKKHMLTNPIDFLNNHLKKQEELEFFFQKPSFFSKRYFSATIIARDLITSSGCRELSPEHNVL